LGENGTAPINASAAGVRVLLVDDHDLFRTGLRTLLEEQDVEIVGEAVNGYEAVRLVEEHAPDVVLMDLDMPGKHGIDATREIAAVAPLTRVVVLTISDQDADVMDAVIAGELFISAKSVKNHISNILLKLSIENRIQAAVFAVRSGLA
jgi:DNA-binding NarL/FixJ family response regulator